MASLIAGTNSTMGIHAFVCEHVYVCMTFDMISTDLLISMFHWLHFYMTGFKLSWWELCWVCIVSIQWTLCTFLQGGCSRHVTYVGIHHHGRRDVSHWVNTGYRPIRFSLTQPHCLYEPASQLTLVQSLITAGCCIPDCTAHSHWMESCVLAYMEAVPNPYYPLQVSRKVPVARPNLHNLYCLGVEVFKSSGIKKMKLHGFSAQANYIGRATAACRRS
jgi:hypothetical protein